MFSASLIVSTIQTCRTGVIFLAYFSLGEQRRKRGERKARVTREGFFAREGFFHARLAFTPVRLKYANKLRLFCRLKECGLIICSGCFNLVTCYVLFCLCSILISVFQEYINYATVEQQLDRLRMDHLLRAMKVSVMFTLC